MNPFILRICSLLGIRCHNPPPDPELSLRKHCTAAPTAKLFPTAQIINCTMKPEDIVLGEYTYVRGELMTFGHGGRVKLGDYCYVGEGTHIWSALSIDIGDRVLISHHVNIFDCDTHPIDDLHARHAQYKHIITAGHPSDITLRERPVRIENDALICCQSIILSGVTIGEGAVVGAGSVVTKDVPPMTLVAGNPARVIRTLTPPEHRA